MTASLFVPEEDVPKAASSASKEIALENEMETDEVVWEVPLRISPLSLHVLQYATRPRRVAGVTVPPLPINSARVKPHSGIWELDVAVNNNAFYNAQKPGAPDNVEKPAEQTLRGVGVEVPGQHALVMREGIAHLMPVNTVAQLRPSFRYLDDAKAQQKDEEYRPSAAQRAQVVTMSVRSVGDTAQQRLGGSLLAHKEEGEEAFVQAVWDDIATDSTFDDFTDKLTTTT